MRLVTKVEERRSSYSREDEKFEEEFIERVNVIG